MSNKLIENLLENAYRNQMEHGEILVDGFLNELDNTEKDILNGFHPRETIQINRNDDYFLSARANTFVVMFGRDEYSGYERTVLIQCNHKGWMHFLMFPY